MAPLQHTVLVLDDEPLVRAMLRDVFQTEGFRALVAGSVEDAENIWNAESSAISLLVIDLTLGGKSGEEMVLSFQKRNPSLRIILISGYLREGPLQPGMEFLEKPFPPRKLLSAAQAQRLLCVLCAAWIFLRI